MVSNHESYDEATLLRLITKHNLELIQYAGEYYYLRQKDAHEQRTINFKLDPAVACRVMRRHA